jgi:hypothetical protein
VNLQRFCVKFFAQASHGLDDAKLINVFHDWIRRRVDLGTLIDVADYRHVPDGPGVMLITHEANFAVDRTEGQRLGLLYQRKTDQDGDTAQRILSAVHHTVTACRMLMDDAHLEGALSFAGGELRVIANDRLLAPNTAAGYEQLVPDLQRVGAALYGTFELQRVNNHHRERLAAQLTSAVPVSMAELAGKV